MTDLQAKKISYTRTILPIIPGAYHTIEFATQPTLPHWHPQAEAKLATAHGAVVEALEPLLRQASVAADSLPRSRWDGEPWWARPDLTAGRRLLLTWSGNRGQPEQATLLEGSCSFSEVSSNQYSAEWTR